VYVSRSQAEMPDEYVSLAGVTPIIIIIIIIALN
tara:strand:- start:573 stop:674 length:102 start_codon:yes stop_codon:yes gene_type:complete